MGIFDRLGSVINSYINDFSDQTNRGFKSPSSRSGDPDLDAAFDELNDFLNDKEPRKKNENSSQYSWQDKDDRASKQAGNIPEELKADFEILGVPFNADEETCKAAYKNLLKIHHPDRHAGHEGNYKKATERTAKINAAWDRIEKWRKLNPRKK
ncbi:MAG: J domain-containing protein [Treponema sp.]|nr:J domain-containing protein [Treponema sp.]